MNAAEYQAALNDLDRLRPSGPASGIATLTYLFGSKRIASDLVRRARRLSDQLRRIEPPPEIAAEHSALIAAVSRAAAELRELAERKDRLPS